MAEVQRQTAGKKKKVTRKKVVKKKAVKKKPKNTARLIDQAEQIDAAEEGLKVNLYGRSGTGKTTFWATFPKPILALVCSGGNKPGELLSIDTPEYRGKIKKFVVTKSDQVTQLCKEVEESLEYATVVLDHATSYQDLILKEVLDLDEIPEQLSWGDATQSDYGQMALQMKERMRSLLNLSTNVVIVAQEREFNTDSESEVLMPYVASALSPSVVGWLNPACDYIFETCIRPKMITKTIGTGKKKKTKKIRGRGVEFCMRTAPDDVYTTKFRVPKGRELPDVVVDPTYDKLIKIIKGQ